MEMMSIRGLTTYAIDSVLEDTIPEDLFLELPEIRVVDVRIECSDEVSSPSLLVGLEVSLPVYHGTSDLECPPAVLMDTLVGSPSAVSMDAHVGLLMPRIDDVVVTSSVVPIEPANPTTLEISGSGAETPMGFSSAKNPMGVALSLCDLGPSTFIPTQTMASDDFITSGSASIVPALGFPLFL